MKWTKQIPNTLTILRILLSVCLLFLILHASQWFKISSVGLNYTSACLFALAGCTDFLDGYIARNYHLKTLFGEIFDPLADKILILAAFLGLLALGRISAWVVFVILGREFFIAGLRMSVSNHGQSIAVSQWGKYKTFLQMCAIVVLFLNVRLGGVALGDCLMAVAVFTTLYSGLDYVLKYCKMVQNGDI
ncbi:CDP-diacylglycerol--glycerol-3-phosphate 3-phosphatidyltransferase [Helicobacter ailurogastricus]|uniref:CDP-diacylglycerol--glycerol-3-phosphate 3-phosphatidyltransferase n=1 Tax=Helicobacter ailurogastricus TaxID=1578720 RepID=A0A0K2Y4Q0_9HELI|nr:CDP-diacylglycerol--glycerol-3-phosphate 3-phosphatidyltransferase [Helicobacter ailurogastricus]BDQ29255.1 CDP-diacylglycerol--glycerol-3-phosphate 3-phosphatidyltransferase [Helicobacter ailurogastricus]CRF52135.1 CDP-diacylglycerol--glycerol-3-phosphate 3-phosphatidyltransferase [Helicobacter ailurogastricus]